MENQKCSFILNYIKVVIYLKNIKYLVMDVDGTLTDGKIYMGNNGEICKAFNIKDGLGIHDIAIPNGVVPIIITGRTSQILQKRCNELGIDKIYQGISNKIEKLNLITDDFSKVAYIGDDINDLSCMLSIKKSGGVIGCPANATKRIIDISDFVSTKNGGDGAVREFIEWIFEE